MHFLLDKAIRSHYTWELNTRSASIAGARFIESERRYSMAAKKKAAKKKR